MGEVLALSLIPLPTTFLRQGVWFSEAVTRLLGLPSPIKTRLVVSTQLKACHRGQNGAVLNGHGWGSTTKKPRNSHNTLPTLPLQVLH
jgi:hypothetical protein